MKNATKRVRLAVLVSRHPAEVRNGATRESGYRMGWRGLHAREFPASPIGKMLAGMGAYADAHERTYGVQLGDDCVLGRAWLEMLGNVREMLNGDLSGMDGGSLWTLTKEMALAAGFTESEADECRYGAE